MSLFNSVTMTVKRTAPGSYIEGHWVSGTPAPDFTIEGTKQSLSRMKMETLPEGKRQSVSYEIYTETELFAADPLTERDSDRIVLGDGYLYEVFSVDEWDNGLIPHFEAIIIREKEIV